MCDVLEHLHTCPFENPVRVGEEEFETSVGSPAWLEHTAADEEEELALEAWNESFATATSELSKGRPCWTSSSASDG